MDFVGFDLHKTSSLRVCCEPLAGESPVLARRGARGVCHRGTEEGRAALPSAGGAVEGGRGRAGGGERAGSQS